VYGNFILYRTEELAVCP